MAENNGTIFYRKHRERSPTINSLLSQKGTIFSLMNILGSFQSLPFPQRRRWCYENNLVKFFLSVSKEVSSKYNKFSSKEHLAIEEAILESCITDFCVYLGHPSRGHYFVHQKTRVKIQTCLLPTRKGSLNVPKYILPVINIGSKENIHYFVSLDEEKCRSFKFPDPLCWDIPKLLKWEVMSERDISGIGPAILRRITKGNNNKLTSLRFELMKLHHTTNIILESDTTESKISVFAPTYLMVKILNSVKNMLSEISASVLEEAAFIQYPWPNGDMTLKMKKGFKISEIYMKEEFTDLLIYKRMSSESKTSVTEYLQEFGETEVIDLYGDSDDLMGGAIGRVRYSSPDSTTEAFQQNIADFLNVYSLKPCYFQHEQQPDSKYEFTVRHCHRKYSKKILVTYRVSKERARTLKKGHRCIKINSYKKNVTYIKADDDDETSEDVVRRQLRVSDVHHTVSLETVRESVERSLNVKVVEIERIHLPSNMTNSFKVYQYFLSNFVKEHLPLGSWYDMTLVDTLEFDKTENFIENKITVPSLYHLKLVIEAIKKEKKILGRTVEVNPQVTYKCCIPRELWKMGLIAETLNNAGGNTVLCDMRKDGSCDVTMSSCCTSELEDVQYRIEGILSPVTIQGLKLDQMRKLNTFEGKILVCNCCATHKVHIEIDKIKGNLKIFGLKQGKKCAIQEMQSFINKTESNIWEIYLDCFGIHKDNKPALIDEIKGNEKEIETVSMATNLNICDEKGLITFEGDTDTYIQVKKYIATLIKNLRKCIASDAWDKYCCACYFCQPSASDMYQLEMCGHFYCKACAFVQLLVAKDEKSFPLTCIEEGCHGLWTWNDVNTILDNDKEALARLIDNSVTAFVAQNPRKASFCPTPDCKGVYRVTKQKALFTCSYCDVKICSHCQVLDHGETPCAIYKLICSQDTDQTLKNWIQEDINKRKVCPECRSGIEKFSGCNQVTCTNCKISLCFVCLMSFNTAKATYRHLSSVHSDIF